MDMGNNYNGNNATLVIAEPAPPAFDSFAWLVRSSSRYQYFSLQEKQAAVETKR